MSQQLLDKLNYLLTMEFGRTSNSMPKYLWARASEAANPVRFGGQIELRSWAQVAGEDCWMVFGWAPPPMSRTAWHQNFGDTFPYPDNGIYLPVGNAIRPLHELPDMDATLALIKYLRRSIDQTTSEFIDLVVQKDQAEKKAHQNLVGEVFDDTLPAFGNLPGKKEHASFPPIAPSISKEVVQ